MLSKGLSEEDEASELLGPLRQQRDKQQVLLESIEEPTNVIELQPKAVRRYTTDKSMKLASKATCLA